MIPHAIIDSRTYLVINTCCWDRKTEWSPPEHCFAVRLDTHPIQPNIGMVWDPHTKTFGMPTMALPFLWLPESRRYKPVRDPIKDIPHKEINWTLCDRGQQSPLIFKPKAEIGEIYEDRMKVMWSEGMYAKPGGAA